jgi:hypothetical protein
MFLPPLDNLHTRYIQSFRLSYSPGKIKHINTLNVALHCTKPGTTRHVQPASSLQAGCPLNGAGDDGEQVVADGVAEVLGEVLDGALPGDVGLDEEGQHGEHGQPAVLDLLHLEQRRLVGVAGQAKRVEGAAGVQLVLKVQAVDDPVVFGTTDEDDLGDHGDDKVDGDAVAEVVEGVAVQDQGAGLHEQM